MSESTSDVIQTFVECLKDHTLLQSLEQAPLDTLNEEQIQNLRKIALMFCDFDEDDHTSGRQSNNRAQRSQPNSNKRRCIETRDPWRVFTKLEALSIPRHLELFLEADDPRRLVDEQFGFKNSVLSMDLVATSGDVVLHCLKWTTLLEQRQSSDRLRWLFAMLMMYDLVRSLWPHLTGRRVSPNMKNELVTIMERKLKRALEGAGLSVEWAAENISRWCVHGSKVQSICETFGTGSLFYLERHLSEDFLLNKFTKSGKYYKAAVDHLKGLGLASMAEESGANLFATKMRDVLKHRFDA